MLVVLVVFAGVFFEKVYGLNLNVIHKYYIHIRDSYQFIRYEFDMCKIGIFFFLISTRLHTKILSGVLFERAMHRF